MGKITVIKSLALPIYIQSLTVLPNPPDYILKDIEKMFFSFLWNKKPDKIKRKVIIGNYERGGLKMPHIESFCWSLKMSWINKLLDPLNISPWKTLIIDQYNKFGGDKIWMMSSEALSKISEFFNPFWKDIINNWGKLKKEKEDETVEVLSQSIWFNEKLKINGKICFWEDWCESGVFFVNDLLNDNNEFYSFEQFKENYNINTTFLHFYGIIHAIPKHWKELILGKTKLPVVSCENFENVKKNKKACQYFYQKFNLDVSELPEKQHDKWGKH